MPPAPVTVSALGRRERHLAQPAGVLAGERASRRSPSAPTRNSSGGDVSVDFENTTKPSPGRAAAIAPPSATALRRAAGGRHDVQVLAALLAGGEPDRRAVLRRARSRHRQIGRLEHRPLRARQRDRRRRDTSDRTRTRRAAARGRRWSGRRARRPAARRPPDSASASSARAAAGRRRSRRRCSSSTPRGRCPSRFETNAISRPSGENAIAASSCCAGGESKSPGVTSTVRLPSTSATKT